MYEDVSIEREESIAWIRLERPDKLNALRTRTFEELADAARVLNSDEDVRVIVLTGSGDRSFSVGVDLVADGRPSGTPEWDEVTAKNADVISSLWYLDKPLVTAVNGYALAAGCNLALISDITIAADTAVFGEPEIRHGALSPVLLLPWLTSFKAMNELYLTGDSVSAERAVELGLINRVVPAAELREHVQAYAQRMANAPLFSMITLKRSIRMLFDAKGFRNSLTAHRFADTLLLSSTGIPEREALFDIYRERGLGAFLEARDGPYRSEGVGP